MDLIDTLWNVKLPGSYHRFICRPRFNRYIVECKGTHIKPRTSSIRDLIDTLWNVKV